MNKVFGFILTIIMVLSPSLVTLADEADLEVNLTTDIIESLTLTDINNCYNMLMDYIQKNPNHSNDDLDNLARKFYLNCYNDENIHPYGYYDDLLVNQFGMNPDEATLALQYPSDLAAVYSSAGIANNETEDRFFAGTYLGNGDAFRHCVWNALIVNRFYALGKGNQSFCMERAKLWTDAHENGTTNDGELTDSQFQADRQMDLLNNAAGREISESYFDATEYENIERAQYYTDHGYLIRIRTDSQLNYTYSQMLEVSNWDLINTSTSGKN